MNRALAAIIGLAVASPLIAVALNAAGVGPGFEVEEPEWSPGHNWQYDLTMTARAHGQIFGLAEGETPTGRIDITRGFEVLNTELEEGGTPLQAALQTAQLERMMLGERVLYDRENPEAAQDEGDDWETGGNDFMMDEDMLCLARCDTGVLLLTKELNPFLSAEAFSAEREGPEVLRFFDFPLTRDKTWTVVSFEEDGILFEIQATAVEEEYINPDGFAPLQAVRIEAGLTDASRDSLKDAIEREAANEDFTLNMDFDLDLTYWYAPKVENVVKFVADAFVTGSGAGYGAAGMFRVDMKMVDDLSAYDLAVKPARDVPDAERLAAAARSAGTESGLSDTPFAFEIGADKRHVDASAGDRVTLSLVPIGQGGETDAAALEAPDDARVEWTHSHPLGDDHAATSTYDGSGLALDIDNAGVHTVTARVFDTHGRLMGADTLEIEGYIDSHYALEPVAAGLGKQLSGVLEIPARAATLTAEIESTGAAIGTLTVEGPNAHEQTNGIRSDAIHIEAPEAGVWTTTWDSTAQAGTHDLHLVVRFQLDDVTPEPSADTGTSNGWLDVLRPLSDLL